MKIGRRVFNTQQMQEELADQCELAHIKPQKMIRAVATRWNSMHPVLERALALRPALDRLVQLPQFNKVPKRKMRKFLLSPGEWNILEHLEKVLQVRFYGDLSQQYINLSIVVHPRHQDTLPLQGPAHPPSDPGVRPPRRQA